jgi:hypothetical protein
MTVALLVVVAASVSPVVAVAPPNGQADLAMPAHAGCQGLVNAYAHGGDVEAVADKHGCDLSGIPPAGHSGQNNADGDHSEGGPPPDVVEAKCAKIAEKLASAQARPHGKSAAAFGRQADKWGRAN